VSIPVPGRIAEALRQSTVQIQIGDAGYSGHGSGAVVGPDQIITNAHVVHGERMRVESWEGKTVKTTLARIDRRRDLALLTAHGINAVPVTLGDSSLLRPGTPVVAIGNPFGFIGALSSGVVHSLGQVNVYGPNGGVGDWICADVRLAPGNSGGPLADFHGHVVGINTMIASGGLAFAVPSRAVQRFLARTEAPPSLGVVVRPVRLRNREVGMLLLELTPDGAAQAASLLAGDILMKADARRLFHPDDLMIAIEESAGGILHLEFYRGNQTHLRQVTARLQPNKVRNAA
jgi:serine protease Do